METDKKGGRIKLRRGKWVHFTGPVSLILPADSGLRHAILHYIVDSAGTIRRDDRPPNEDEKDNA